MQDLRTGRPVAVPRGPMQRPGHPGVTFTLPNVGFQGAGAPVPSPMPAMPAGEPVLPNGGVPPAAPPMFPAQFLPMVSTTMPAVGNNQVQVDGYAAPGAGPVGARLNMLRAHPMARRQRPTKGSTSAGSSQHGRTFQDR